MLTKKVGQLIFFTNVFDSIQFFSFNYTSWKMTIFDTRRKTWLEFGNGDTANLLKSKGSADIKEKFLYF